LDAGTDGARCQDHSRAGELPDRLQSGVPGQVPGQRHGAVRLEGLPQVGEQPGRAPQQRAQGGAGQTQPAAPRRRRPLRRLLRRRHGPHRRPTQARVRRRAAGVVLRRRRRAVQRRLRGAVRREAGHGVPRPVHGGVVGRVPLHGPRVQAHRGRRAAGDAQPPPALISAVTVRIHVCAFGSYNQ
jgi:hypothetical protein